MSINILITISIIISKLKPTPLNQRTRAIFRNILKVSTDTKTFHLSERQQLSFQISHIARVTLFFYCSVHLRTPAMFHSEADGMKIIVWLTYQMIPFTPCLLSQI